MVRSLALIILAIQLSRPTIPRQEAVHYAKVLQQEAKEHDFDPFTGVAIIHFESYWHPGVVSKDGEDYGLAQIRARYIRGCRNDEDPLNAPSAECQSAKARLLDGATNIRRMAALITANRELCKEKRGRVWFHEWLASYQGRNRPKEDKWCTPGEGTWRVVNYRKELIAKLIPAPPKKHVSKAAKTSTSSKASSKTSKAKRRTTRKSTAKGKQAKADDSAPRRKPSHANSKGSPAPSKAAARKATTSKSKASASSASKRKATKAAASKSKASGKSHKR